MASRDRFVYRRTSEEVSEHTRKAGGSFDQYIVTDVPTMKIKEGESTIRIIKPHWLDAQDEDLRKQWGSSWAITIHVHYSVGPDNSTYLCLEKMKKERCPVCEAWRAAEDKDEQYKLRPSKRFVAWVVDRNNERIGPQVCSMSPSLYEDINKRIQPKGREPIPLDDAEEGVDVTFTREGTDLHTDYTGVELARDPSPLHEDEKLQNKWLDYCEDHALPTVLNFYDAEYLDKILSGRISRDRGNGIRRAETRRDDEDRRSSRSEGERRTTSRSRRDEDDDKPPFEDDKPLVRSRRAAPEDKEPEERDTRDSGRKSARPGKDDDNDADDDKGIRRTSRRAAPAEDDDKESSDPDDDAEGSNGEPSRAMRRNMKRLEERRSNR